MDQKKGGLLQRAMPPITYEGSRIRPIASTYNVMITLVYPLFFGSSTDGRPSNKKSQREYAAPKIIPSAANVATKLFLWKAPTEMGNSPIKLLVPGELILAKVEEKEMVERFGMVLTEPP
ncbi:hypothetical protein BVC80_7573g2 [Macleaya cordata]|uniref:Uncharacterized protein n=1 Tax=Macleaya cordata TaxID=56857 RepID=A0A200QKC6_MACCD|nr:hypothetical protein BVC80_7573g2 [Macleaya cordata]